MRDRVMEKLTSGRWLLTAGVGAGWLWLVVSGGVDNKDAMAAFLLVANWYFNREDRNITRHPNGA